MTAIPFEDYCDRPGTDLIRCMPRRGAFPLAPITCAVGEIGLPTTQRTGEPDGPGNCIPAITDGTTVRPASEWRPVMDYYLDYEFDRKFEWVAQVMVTHQASQLYNLGNNVDAYTQAWLAFNDQAYLTRALEICEAVIGVTRPSNELDSFATNTGAFDDTYQSWDTYGLTLGYARASGQSLQNEAQFCKQALYLCAKARADATVTGALAARVEAVRSFCEVNVFEKWYYRGAPPAIAEDTGHYIVEGIDHMDGYARWASIAAVFQAMHPAGSGLTNAANWARIQDIATKTGDGWVAGNGDTRGVRQNLIDHPNNAAHWFFNRFFEPAPVVPVGTGDDISHANHAVRYIADAVELGGVDGWTAADLDRWRDTFTNELWNGSHTNFQTSTYLDGVTGTGNYWLQDGWFSLGRTSQAFQSIIQNKPAWVTNYWSQHYAHLARNAHDLGFD